MQADDNLKGLQILARKLERLVCPEGTDVSGLLEQEQICLRPPGCEAAMQQLDKTNVSLAHALQKLMQARIGLMLGCCIGLSYQVSWAGMGQSSSHASDPRSVLGLQFMSFLIKCWHLWIPSRG